MAMKQLELQYNPPIELNVDGMHDATAEGIRYLGKAAKQIDGTWRCLADVYGCLCIVQVNIKMVDCEGIEPSAAPVRGEPVPQQHSP
jgi:hypothetical protein